MSTSIANLVDILQKDCEANTEDMVGNPSELDPENLSKSEVIEALSCGGYLLVEHWCDWALREIVAGRWDVTGGKTQKTGKARRKG